MSEVVPVVTAPESQISEEATPEVAAEPATPAFDESTYKKKIQGYTQAITAAKKEAEVAKAEAAALSKWKAEQEQADMTELQKAQAEVTRLQSIAAAAEAKATAAQLRGQYPLAAELLGDDLAKFDEVRVAEINGRLAKEQEAESEEPEARIDPNSPRRAVPKPPASDLAAAKAALTAAGNPWFDENAQ